MTFCKALNLQGQDHPPPDSKLTGTVDKLLIGCPQLASRASAAWHWRVLCSSSSSWTPRPTLSLNRFEMVWIFGGNFSEGKRPHFLLSGLTGTWQCQPTVYYSLGQRAPHARFAPSSKAPAQEAELLSKNCRFTFLKHSVGQKND